MTKHTIVLIQFTQSRGTRSYNDYETVALAMDGKYLKLIKFIRYLPSL